MEQPEKIAESNMNVDIGVKVQANLDPLVQATPKGLKTLFSLLLGKRYIDADRAARLSEAQNAVDARKIIQGEATFDQVTGGLLETSTGRNEIRALVREAIQDNEIANLISCTVHASKDIANDKISNESEVSSEFLNRWRNEAKFISEETAQVIWGRILSEEVKEPNSISIRTLDVIKSLTKEEAEAFREACKFVFFERLLFDSTVDGIPIPQQSYELLRDAGLIVNYQKGFYSGTTWPSTKILFDKAPVEVHYLRVGKIFIYAEKSQVKEPPSSSYWQLTKAGREMCRIISRELEYDVFALANALADNSPDLKGLLKHTVYSSVEKNEIDFSRIQSVF